MLTTLPSTPYQSAPPGRPAAPASTSAPKARKDATAARLVFIVSNSLNYEMGDVLRSRNWTVETGPPTARFLKMLAESDAACAVLDFSSHFSTTERALLDGFMSSPLSAPVSWVGLISQKQRSDADIKRAIAEHCFDYVTQPISPDQLASVVGHAFGMLLLQIEAENQVGDAQQPLLGNVPAGYEMLGSCKAMLKIEKTIRKIATTGAPVFIAGETGTGKELTARAIHACSPRADKPFIAINCGAIPPSLLQAELFGHEKGAFTGASQRKIGRIESADRGTLFLDEIGDLPFESQASLLRFIQEQKIERLGGGKFIDVDVRIVAATHVNMEEAITDGRFRSDLFYRLCVLRVDQPPLRERGGDVEIVARFMLNRYRSEAGRRVRGFSSDAILALYNYDWPGNVRELINRVRRAVVMSEGEFITAKDLELLSFSNVRPTSLAETRENAERDAIEFALQRQSGDLDAAADDLGISKAILSKMMRSLNIDPSIVKFM